MYSQEHVLNTWFTLLTTYCKFDFHISFCASSDLCFFCPSRLFTVFMYMCMIEGCVSCIGRYLGVIPSFPHPSPIYTHRANSSFVVVCSQYTEMLEGNIIAPHKFIRVSLSSHESIPVLCYFDCAGSRMCMLKHHIIIHAHVQYISLQKAMRCMFSLNYVSVESVLPQIKTVSICLCT